MNTKHTKEDRLKFQLDRIALFSDAVFAIAITLLVIEIRVPIIDQSADFNKNLFHALHHMLPEFIGFIISFIVVGQAWKSHHTMFGFVADYDRKLLTINTWLLFTIVCMPFTTGLISRYMFFNPYFIYCMNIVMMGLLQAALWSHITSPKNHLCTDVPLGMKRYNNINTVIVVGFFVLSLPVHRIFGGQIARMFLALIFIIQAISSSFFKRKYSLGRKI